MRKERLISEVLGEHAGLAPSDLYNTEFKSSLVGGYDKNEVDAFLERVGDEFEALLRRGKALAAEVEELKERIKRFEETEVALRDALTSAQRFSEDLAESARREADALLEEARLQKIQAEAASAELPVALRDEIEALKAARNRLREDLMAVIETHGALAENIPAAEAVHADAYGRRTQESEEDIGVGSEPDPEDEPEPPLKPLSRPLTIERMPWDAAQDDETGEEPETDEDEPE